MKIDGVSIRVGNILEYEGKLWAVTKTQHTQPGKGGAYMQVEMKDIRVGTKTNVRFRSDESVELVRLDETKYQFLYTEGDMINLMHPETFEQISLASDVLGDALPFLQEGMILSVQSYEESPVSVTMPDKVVETIDETEPVVKGQTAASSYKPAKLANGVRVMVPPFIGSGDRVVVDTRDFTYVERAKE